MKIYFLLVLFFASSFSFYAVGFTSDSKDLKGQQKVIASILKTAERDATLSKKDRSIDAPNFESARIAIANALSSPNADSMLGEINRVAGNVEYNICMYNLAGAQNLDPDTLSVFF